MLRKILAILLVFVVAGWAFTGCKDKDEEPKTMKEYRQEAAKTITKENAEKELEKIQQEIEAEAETQ